MNAVNALNWFEIPTVDLERAARFYETVLATSLRRETFLGVPHAIFPFERPHGVGGALVQTDQQKPARDGARLYLAVSNLDSALAKVVEAGGTVQLGRTDIGEMGTFAVIVDTEGNSVGIHANRS